MTQPFLSEDISQPHPETILLIKHVRKSFLKYLSLVLAIGILSYYILKVYVLGYSATSSFFVNDHSNVYNSTIENIPFGDNLNRVYQMVNSSPTQFHLIKKFDLYRHFGIDTTKEFYLQRVVDIVKSKIDVKKNPFNTISVTVSDKSRYLAAEMANEVVSFVEKINQDFYIKNIQNTLQISQAYLMKLELDNNIKSAGIDSLIKKINDIISSNSLSESNRYYLLLQQQKLSGLINIFQNSVNDLINSQKLYNSSLQAINFKNFPTITVLQTAMPSSYSNSVSALIYSVLIMVLAFMILILQAYFKMHYKNYLHLFLTGK